MSEPAADDGVPGHGGCTMCQIFVGMISEHIALYPMKNKGSVPNALRDFIRNFGAMKGLRSDNSKEQTSEAMKDIFHMYMIDDNQTEPHYQHRPLYVLAMSAFYLLLLAEGLEFSL